MESGRMRPALIGLTAFTGGVAVTAAFLEGLVFTEFTAGIVLLGFLAGIVLIAAALLLIGGSPWAGPAAMLGGVLMILVGAVEFAAVGAVYEAPLATQPAWLQEVFSVVAGAVTGALGASVWHPGARSRATTSAAGVH